MSAPPGRLVNARLHPDDTVFYHVDAADAVFYEIAREFAQVLDDSSAPKHARTIFI
jgi:hypothetical protein